MGSIDTFDKIELSSGIWMIQGDEENRWLVCEEWQVEMIRNLIDSERSDIKNKHNPTTVQKTVNGYQYEMYYEAMYHMFQHSEIILHNINTGTKRLLFLAITNVPTHLGASKSLTYFLNGYAGKHIKEKRASRMRSIRSNGSKISGSRKSYSSRSGGSSSNTNSSGSGNTNSISSSGNNNSISSSGSTNNTSSSGSTNNTSSSSKNSE